MLADSKFNRLSKMDAHYFKNIDRVKRLAAELKMQVVPALFSIGYSNDLLSNDPNLAEGLPVRDALFVVHDGAAQLVPGPAVPIRTKLPKGTRLRVSFYHMVWRARCPSSRRSTWQRNYRDLEKLGDAIRAFDRR